MAFKTGLVRQVETVPVATLEDVAKKGFSGDVVGLGRVTVNQSQASDEPIRIEIQQSFTEGDIRNRKLVIAVGTKTGECGFQSATVDTETILGDVRTQRITDLRDLNKNVLTTTPLATVIRAIAFAKKEAEQATA